MIISQEKETALRERMERLGVREEEFRETFIRSSGPGGQKVNKTSSCVYLVHLPTGLSVKCQQERSQTLNRFLARRLLLDRIERLRTGLIARRRRGSKRSGGRKGAVPGGQRRRPWRRSTSSPKRRPSAPVSARTSNKTKKGRESRGVRFPLPDFL